MVTGCIITSPFNNTNPQFKNRANTTQNNPISRILKSSASDQYSNGHAPIEWKIDVPPNTSRVAKTIIVDRKKVRLASKTIISFESDKDQGDRGRDSRLPLRYNHYYHYNQHEYQRLLFCMMLARVGVIDRD